MSGFWSLIVRHWKELGITVPSAIGAMGWVYARYRARRQKRLDTKVFEALGKHKQAAVEARVKPLNSQHVLYEQIDAGFPKKANGEIDWNDNAYSE